jgi:hypothetical protein
LRHLLARGPAAQRIHLRPQALHGVGERLQLIGEHQIRWSGGGARDFGSRRGVPCRLLAVECLLGRGLGAQGLDDHVLEERDLRFRRFESLAQGDHLGFRRAALRTRLADPLCGLLHQGIEPIGQRSGFGIAHLRRVLVGGLHDRPERACSTPDQQGCKGDMPVPADIACHGCLPD